MPPCAIRIENLSKKFYLGQDVDYSRLSESLQRAAVGWLKRRATQHEQDLKNLEDRNTFWALKGIDCEVQQGEILGIIGRNGAGKSTLLKILSRITRPTVGRFGLRGRVGSLLEVGTGFHPELTGRENIYLNGSILGMKKREIDLKFHKIVEFAEIGQFLDTPVKRYSSGMYTRLAFSVAAHLETDILIVDEVLAVGDATFQRKCLGKMSEVAHQGRTVLFVSHNMAAIKSLCTHGLYLEHGSCVCQGNLDTVIDTYHQKSMENLALQRVWQPEEAPGNSSARLLLAEAQTKTHDCISVDSGLSLAFEVAVYQPESQYNLVLRLETIDSLLVMQQEALICTPEQNFPQRYRCSANLPGNILNQGHYRISVVLVDYITHTQIVLDNLLQFTVAPNPLDNEKAHQPGVICPDLQFQTINLGPEPPLTN